MSDFKYILGKLFFGGITVFIFCVGMFKAMGTQTDWPGHHPIEASLWVTMWLLGMFVFAAIASSIGD